MKRKLVFIFCLFTIQISSGQNAVSTTTLESCLRATGENYPMVAQNDVIDKLTSEAVLKANSLWQPQVVFNAQATYQSDVVELPVESPLFEIPELSKDQYKATIDVTQTIYDGGLSSQQKDLVSLNGEIEKQKVAIDIYKAKERVVQLYTSILLADENIALINQILSDLDTKRNALAAGLQNGVVTQNSIDLLDAEIIKTKQKFIEATWAKKTSINLLSVLTGLALSDATAFETPSLSSNEDTINKRPELSLFESQANYVLRQREFSNSLTLPRISLFVEGGYGRPGLNYLLDEFDFYYIAGIKFSYPIWQGQVKKHDASIYSLNLLTIENQRNLFLMNTTAQTTQQTDEMQKLQQLMELDSQIIQIREKTKSTAAVQLENGVITATDYINELNAGLEASQNLAIHRAQYISAQANYLIQLGKL